MLLEKYLSIFPPRCWPVPVGDSWQVNSLQIRENGNTCLHSLTSDQVTPVRFRAWAQSSQTSPASFSAHLLRTLAQTPAFSSYPQTAVSASSFLISFFHLPHLNLSASASYFSFNVKFLQHPHWVEDKKFRIIYKFSLLFSDTRVPLNAPQRWGTRSSEG